MRQSMSSRTRGGRFAAVLVAVAASALAAGCGSGKKNGAASDGGTKQTLEVSLAESGCSPANLRAQTGTVTFNVSNSGTTKVSEFEVKNADGIILGERENIVGGISGSFTLDLAPGRYTISCPNGDTEDNGVLVVTGKAEPAANAAAPLLKRATAGYHAYVVAQTAQLLAGTRRFVAALQSGDLEGAKNLFGPVRLSYEAIEPVAESFGNLDPEIDARVNDVDESAEWTGFHRIEQILWLKRTTAGTASLGRKLLADVATLQQRARTLAFQPAQLANGAVELLNEVAGSKITGEEDRYAHTDLSDFQGNLNGARVAFELLRPALVKRGEGALVRTIAARFATVQNGLDRYKRATLLGFATYDELTATDRRAFAQRIDALAEPLSTVAAKVTG
jgi:iron uptake system component EfeO